MASDDRGQPLLLSLFPKEGSTLFGIMELGDSTTYEQTRAAVVDGSPLLAIPLTAMYVLGLLGDPDKQ
jgi:hypothetical protein